jgi:hypothetical protein
MIRKLASLILAGLTFACGGDGTVNSTIAASVEKGPGTRLILAEQTPYAWDKLCIFGPYTPDEKVDSVTGVQGAAGQAHGIRANDGINVLMFISQGGLAASVAHPRDQGDFGPEVVGKCYSKQQARFLVRIPPSGSWGNIGPG